MKINGSPAPEFDMDEERTYLNTIIHIRDGFAHEGEMSDKLSDKLSDKEKMVLKEFLYLYSQFSYVTTKALAEQLHVSLPTARRYINILCENKIIRAEGNNKNKKYYLL